MTALAAILAILGGLFFYSARAKAGPPDLRAVVHDQGNGEFNLVVSNLGGTTAEDVLVEVISGDETVEVEFTAIAKGDKEEATLMFERPDGVRAKVTGFKEP